MYKLGLRFLGLFAVLALLNPGSSVACGDASVEFKKGDYSSKRSEPIVVEGEDTKVLEASVFNSSNDYRLGVRLMDNLGEMRMNTQLMPGTSLAFTEYLSEGTYFLTLYNPYWDHAGPEGYAFVNLKDVEDEDGEEGSEGGSGSEGSSGSGTESGGDEDSESKSETKSETKSDSKADESTHGTKTPEVECSK